MSDPAPKGSDDDRRLLEGLFQLTLDGQTGGKVYDKLDSELYERLLSAYGGNTPPGPPARIDRSAA